MVFLCSPLECSPLGLRGSLIRARVRAAVALLSGSLLDWTTSFLLVTATIARLLGDNGLCTIGLTVAVLADDALATAEAEAGTSKTGRVDATAVAAVPIVTAGSQRLELLFHGSSLVSALCRAALVDKRLFLGNNLL